MDNKLHRWIKCPSLSKFSVKFCKGKVIAIFVTNCIDIWAEKLDEKTFLQRSQDSGISGSIDSILEELERMVSSSEENQDFTSQENEMVHATLTLRSSIQLTTKKAKIRIEFLMEKLSRIEFFHHVTLPMTVTCWHLQKQKDELINMLLSKDTEIAEYKANNSINIARKNLVTKPFNLKAFQDQQTAFQISNELFLNPATFLESLHDYSVIWQRMEELKIVEPFSVPEEPPNIKVEVQEEVPIKKIKTEKVLRVPAPPVRLHKQKRIL